MPSPPAALVAGPAPPPPCMPASRLPSRTGRFPISFRLLRFAEQRPRHARLCYSSARPGVSLHCRRMAKLSKAKPSHFVAAPCFSIAMRRIGLLRLSVAYAAVLCFSLALSRGATPSRDIAFQSRRPANLGGALPSPCHASLCLRQAMLIKATPSLPVSVHRRCMPRLCFAVASLCFAPQCRGRSWLLMAELPNAAAHRFVAGPSRGRSFPRCSFANRSTALLFLRRSRLSRAFPSPRRAKQISSFAALGLAGLLRRRAAPRYARPFRRLPEQSRALPSQCPALPRIAIALPCRP